LEGSIYGRCSFLQPEIAITWWFSSISKINSAYF
jgi:hypothetical protein